MPPAARRAGAGRLYAWEDRVVAPRDRSLVPFARLQALVDHVWAAEGLRFPPRVRPLPRQARRTLARATRLAIEAPEALPSWVLLHEIAHAMTSTAEGAHDGHGPAFVGIYLRLLVRHAGMDGAALARSLAAAGIPFDPEARPAFLDGPSPATLRRHRREGTGSCARGSSLSAPARSAAMSAGTSPGSATT